MCHIGGKRFSNLQQMGLLFIREGVNGRDGDLVIMCITPASSCFMLFLVVCRVFKYMERLSFDSSAETDLAGRFLTSSNILVSTPAGNRTRDILHGKRTLCHYTRAYSCHCRVGERQRQGRRSERSDEKERDRGRVGKTAYFNPGNQRGHRGGRVEGKHKKRAKSKKQ